MKQNKDKETDEPDKRSNRMKQTVVGWLLIVLLAIPVYTPAVPRRMSAPRPIGYDYVKVKGIGVHVVKVDMNAKVKVGVVTAGNIVGLAEPVSVMLRRTRPTVAVTGTYFDLRSRLPVGTIVTNGKVRHQSCLGTALTITPSNKVRFFDLPIGRCPTWKGYQTVLVSGPRLIYHGKVLLYPEAQGFRDKRLFGYRRRVAVGLTQQNKLVFVVVNRGILLRQLAHIMKRLGCIEAMNLDGGTSASLYYRGRVLVKPGRWLTNLLVAYENVPPSPRQLAAAR